MKPGMIFSFRQVLRKVIAVSQLIILFSIFSKLRMLLFCEGINSAMLLANSLPRWFPLVVVDVVVTDRFRPLQDILSVE